MDTQIVVSSLLALVLILFVMRTLKIRSLKQYTAAQLDSAMKGSSNIVLLDVRTAEERGRSSIRGSVHIPLQSLRSRMQELEKLRTKEIVCYCQSGSRSVSAALQLRKSGFTVANLKGGMADWNFAHR